jgi:hypothetical protein
LSAITSGSVSGVTFEVDREIVVGEGGVHPPRELDQARVLLGQRFEP